jgi:hypothetical protein
MSSSAAYATTPRMTLVTLTGAPGAGYRAGSSATSLVACIVGAASGTRIDRVLLKHSGVAAGAATAGLSVLFFLYDGSTRRLVAEVDVGAVGTPSAGTATYQASVPFLSGLLLPSGSYQLEGVVAGWVDADDDFTVAVVGADF